MTELRTFQSFPQPSAAVATGSNQTFRQGSAYYATGGSKVCFAAPMPAIRPFTLIREPHCHNT